jgi:hypothetical protein
LELGDRPKEGGFLNKVKQGIYKRIDPAAKEEEKGRIRETMRVRQNVIKDEQKYRADVRAGKQKGGIRDYVGSVYNESKNKRAISGLEEKLDPNLKKMRAFERREKFGNAFGKVENAFDKIGDAYDSAGKYFDNSSGKKGSGSVFGGLDIDELAGLKGTGFGGSSAPRRKSSGSRSKQVPIYRGSRIVGYRQAGGTSKRRAPKREASDWSDLF